MDYIFGDYPFCEEHDDSSELKRTRAVKWKVRVKQKIIVMWKITVNILTKVLKCTH